MKINRYFLQAAFVILATGSSFTQNKIPTEADVGVPEQFRGGSGTVVMKVGETTALSMTRGSGYLNIDSRLPFGGEALSFESAIFQVFGPGTVVSQGTDSAKIKATASGQGYIQAHRFFTYRDGGETRRSLVVAVWILVVNETGRIETGDQLSGILPESTVKGDIPKAYISGRAVMRGTDTGVANANVQLIGKKSGVARETGTTGNDGSFSFSVENIVSSDKYEVFIRKGSANVARADSFQEDLWPINKYYVSINQENCKNLNVGRIEMATVDSLWGGSVPANRREVDITPQAMPATQPPGAPGQASSAPSLPWDQIKSGAVEIFIMRTDNREDDAPGETTEGTAGATRSMSVNYKGYAEVDFYLKATMTLKFKGTDVSGELYAPSVSGRNVRLPGARMQLQGQLTGEWEDGGTITGNCAGKVLWPGGQPEDREGSFNIRKVGNEIHFQSTKFYYNRYIFGAQGVKYTGEPGTVPSGSAVNSVVVLIDASGSMAGAKMDNAKATAKQRIAGLGPNTELAVIAFSGNSVRFPFALMDAEGRARAQKAVDGITAGGGTPLAAAIREAGKYMRHNARGRQLSLIVLSDGEETAGGNPPEEVRRLNDMSVSW